MNKVIYALIGLVAAVIFVAILLPARALTIATDRIDDVTLLGISGTLWHGEADVVYRGIEAGRLAWSVDWPALSQLRLGARWQLERGGHSLAGRAERGFDSAALTVAGSVAAADANALLDNYDIHTSGTLVVDHLSVYVDGGALALAGQLRWSGGRTNYRLAGQNYDVELPPMIASLATQQGEAVLDARLEENNVPLLKGRLRDGWVEVGITKRFTQLAGMPWPGNAADHAVVLTVERELPDAWWPAGRLLDGAAATPQQRGVPLEPRAVARQPHALQAHPR